MRTPFTLLTSLFERSAAWFPVLLLAILAAMTYWLEGKVQGAALEQRLKELNLPDQFLERFTARRYTAEGALTQSLTALRATAFPQLNQSVVESPKLSITSASKPEQKIQADTAVVVGKNERIEFKGGVIATQAATGKQQATMIQSNTLTSYPASNRLLSKETVHITQGDKTFDATSLDYNSKTQQFQTGRVRIELAPSPQGKLN
ncbi:MAG: hypothetical protein RLZZ502_1227 [Pseudomonadota bacterium]